jgi:hypothetical protein
MKKIDENYIAEIKIPRFAKRVAIAGALFGGLMAAPHIAKKVIPAKQPVISNTGDGLPDLPRDTGIHWRQENSRFFGKTDYMD